MSSESFGPRLRYSLLLFLAFNAWVAAVHAQVGCPSPVESAVLEDSATPVTIKLTINKIYGIDSRAETYSIDGYLEASWPGADAEPNDYINAQAVQQIESGSVRPMPEFVNTVGSPDVQNIKLTINDDGTADYMARFTATFSTRMEFRQYPFDTQRFAIEIESFAEERASVRLVDCGVDFADPKLSRVILPEWNFDSNAVTTSVEDYEYADESVYSRYRAEIRLERNPGYFLWQFFLPLFLIVATSWFVFWIADFGSKLGFAATLMLTIVAFNLYVSGLLPRLPYNTFIEVTIISGYVAVFLTIVAVVIERLMRRAGREMAADRLIGTCRWLFPSGYAACMLILTVRFHILV